ncbi:hypothetical protein ACNSOP_04490 [Aliarcobacter lanthieri]|uniref:hypothetical protein n=1 Tax=Aliarcobacter lanthieri TaxID=1355374 RepID=UPI003AA8BF9A
MEISNNQNLYTNYLKTKKEDTLIPLEVFQIDKTNMVENIDKSYNKEEYISQSSIENWISYNIKNGTNKDTLVNQRKKDVDPVSWEHLGNNPTASDIANEWSNQVKNATFGNVYEDAKDFENFVAKWIGKGYPEDEALERANFYAIAGLLDYGKQKATAIYSEDLGYDDKKQHGFHLIDNPPLKKAFLETLDSLDANEVAGLVCNIFLGYPNQVSSSFQELLNQFGVKLEDLKQNQSEEERSKFTFTGDININDKMSLEYQNFIFDTLIGFFKDRVNFLDKFMEDTPQAPKGELDYIKNAYDTLIENFKKNTKEYNETKNILNQYMKS